MKDSKILININKYQARVSLLEENKLAEFYIEQTESQRLIGNIYLGVVRNIVPAIQAAFVDIGIEVNAFLHINEIIPDIELYNFFSVESVSEAALQMSNQDITSLLSEGQEILVQVIKEPYKNKGPQITTKCTLPAKYLVYLPLINHIGVSHRIENEQEKERLINLVKKLRPGKGGYIIRTQAEGISESELKKEIEFLNNSWSTLKERKYNKKAPYIINRDNNLVTRVIRDLYNENVSVIIIDSKEEYDFMSNYLKTNYPDLKIYIEFYEGNVPLFEKFKIEKEIEKALKRKVWLKNGSYIVIDETEALSSIDVNSGKYVKENSLEDTVFNTNLTAIPEIVRQIRLRNLSGLIVIDFIDMLEEKHKEIILDKFKEELKKDRVKSYIAGYSNFGLIELTRKRQGKSLTQLLYNECSCCRGFGRTKLFKWTRAEIERKIQENIKYYGRTNFDILLNENLYINLKNSDFWEYYESKYIKNINFILDNNLLDDEYIFQFIPKVEVKDYENNYNI